MRSKAKQAIAVLMGGLSDEDAVKQHNEAARQSVIVPCPHCGKSNDNLKKVLTVAPRGTGKPELLRDLDYRRCLECRGPWWVMCDPQDKFMAAKIWFRKPSANTLYYGDQNEFDNQYRKLNEPGSTYVGEYYPARGR